MELTWEHSVETERPGQRPCCILGQLKLATIHIAGCLLQKPDTVFRTSKNVPLCCFGTCLMFLGVAYLSLGREKNFHICTQPLCSASFLQPAVCECAGGSLLSTEGFMQSGDLAGRCAESSAANSCPPGLGSCGRQSAPLSLWAPASLEGLVLPVWLTSPAK